MIEGYLAIFAYLLSHLSLRRFSNWWDLSHYFCSFFAFHKGSDSQESDSYCPWRDSWILLRDYFDYLFDPIDWSWNYWYFYRKSSLIFHLRAIYYYIRPGFWIYFENYLILPLPMQEGDLAMSLLFSSVTLRQRSISRSLHQLVILADLVSALRAVHRRIDKKCSTIRRLTVSLFSLCPTGGWSLSGKR